MSVNSFEDMQIESPSFPCKYHQFDQTHNSFTSHSSVLLFYLSIRSFNSNLDTLSVHLDEMQKKVDILASTEIWFSGGFCQDIEAYMGYHVQRSERAGGGVSIYVRQGLESTQIITDSL